MGSGAGGRRVDPSQRRRRRWTARGHGCRRDPDRWVGTKRRGRRGREAPATANRHRRASKADQRTSPRRKSQWRQRSRAASGRRHRGLRAPRSASMAWPATRLTSAASLEPSSIFSAKSLHDSGDSVARLGDESPEWCKLLALKNRTGFEARRRRQASAEASMASAGGCPRPPPPW